MEKNRVFTKEELKQMGMRTIDAALQALEVDDKETTKRLIKRMHREFESLHDIYLNWVADIMDYVYVQDGEAALYEALRKAVGSFSGPLIKRYAKADFRQQVEMLAMGLRAHLKNLIIEEDDEKVCIKGDPCGSGTCLFRSGGYSPPRSLSKLKPHPMTWGLSDFPIYCAHSPVQEILSIEKLGYPVIVTFPANEVVEESCRMCIFKDPKLIPEEVYRRVGMKRENH
jgi:hypothetical protein